MAWFDWQRVIGLRGPDYQRGSTGLGPDFPDDAGGRERGKFRPSEYPRLDVVAVSNDDGTPIAGGPALLAKMDELILEMRRLRLGLVANDIAEDVSHSDAVARSA